MARKSRRGALARRYGRTGVRRKLDALHAQLEDANAALASGKGPKARRQIERATRALLALRDELGAHVRLDVDSEHVRARIAVQP